MNVAEVREIRETIYERTKDFTYEELYDYYAKGAEKAEQRIAEIRKEKGIVFKRLNE